MAKSSNGRGQNRQYDTNTTWLPLISKQFRSYFGERVEREDLETLSFSLYHLFYRIDLLYLTTLPALMKCAAYKVQQTIPDDTIQHRHCIWTQLRILQSTLERIELFGHLLNDVAISILEALNTPDQTDVKTRERQEEVSFRDLAGHIASWQLCLQDYPPFAAQFADLASAVPSLEHMDTALYRLFYSSAAIFGTILPSIQLSGIIDDEAIATIVLDLMQHVDEIGIHVPILLEPLPILMQHYAISYDLPSS